MNTSRRKLLLGSACTVLLTNFWKIETSKAAIVAGSDPGDRKNLIKMIRVLYPHDRFPDAPYERTADDVINKGNASPAQSFMMQNGLDKLKSSAFENMSFKDATKYLQSIESSSFFSHVRGTSVVTLYADKEVWSLLGYEGPSFDQGGYINRGFNDLDWLPEPRIEEHPDLANFLKLNENQFASSE
tara:strand:- start:234 stop:791 length:558 start_codon:yes stop_codon:yes gene_type:complete